MNAQAAAFAQALFIGLSIAAPVGPIGLLVIQRSVRDGRAMGLATGLGAAVADAAYGAVGAFGVSGVIQALQRVQQPLALAGAAFMGWLAWRTWRAPLATQAAAVPNAASLMAAFGSTLVLTLSNPATIFSFIAIFSAMSVGSRAGVGAASPWLMVLGVCIGSAAWWLLLSAGVARWRHRFTPAWQRGINRASALLLGAFALWQVLRWV